MWWIRISARRCRISSAKDVTDWRKFATRWVVVFSASMTQLMPGRFHLSCTNSSMRSCCSVGRFTRLLSQPALCLRLLSLHLSSPRRKAGSKSFKLEFAKTRRWDFIISSWSLKSLMFVKFRLFMRIQLRSMFLWTLLEITSRCRRFSRYSANHSWRVRRVESIRRRSKMRTTSQAARKRTRMTKMTKEMKKMKAMRIKRLVREKSKSISKKIEMSSRHNSLRSRLIRRRSTISTASMLRRKRARTTLRRDVRRKAARRVTRIVRRARRKRSLSRQRLSVSSFSSRLLTRNLSLIFDEVRGVRRRRRLGREKDRSRAEKITRARRQNVAAAQASSRALFPLFFLYDRVWIFSFSSKSE